MPSSCPHSVNTPTKQHGIGAGKAADLAYWESAARTIAAVSTTSKIIVEKASFPPPAAHLICPQCLPPARRAAHLPSSPSTPLNPTP